MLGFKKMLLALIILSSVVWLSACDKEVRLDGILVCQTITPNFGYTGEGEEPCLFNNGELQLWSKDSRYQADLARFDVGSLTGVANPDGSLEGSWIFIYQNIPYLGSALTRETCNLKKKSGSNDVYQADCETLKNFGDLTYSPATTSISTEGVGTWPVSEGTHSILGYESKWENISVINSAKIKGNAQFRYYVSFEGCTDQNGDVVPSGTCYDAWQDMEIALVRIGDVDQALGQLKLRDLSALEIDNSAPYTDTLPVTGFKEVIIPHEGDDLSFPSNRHVAGFRYELFSGANTPSSRVLVTKGKHGEWWPRGYVCVNNGTSNGCDSVSDYPQEDEATRYLQIPERAMAIVTDGGSVSDADLVAQPSAYFDTLANDDKQLKLHFQYHNEPTAQDGLIELNY